MFSDAMHGSTVKGASNAEPLLRTATDIAFIGKWGFAGEGSFSASKNKHYPSPVFIMCVDSSLPDSIKFINV